MFSEGEIKILREIRRKSNSIRKYAESKRQIVSDAYGLHIPFLFKLLKEVSLHEVFDEEEN